VTEHRFREALNAQADKLTLRTCGLLGGLMTIGFAAIWLTIAFS